MTDRLTCDVDSCSNPAMAKALPTYGVTDHEGLRCRACLLYDLERDWFKKWRQEILSDG